MVRARRCSAAKSISLFGDGYGLSFWLNGASSAGCCVFVGGPFVESRYFGEGIGIAVKRGNDTLRLAINWALFRIWETGRFTDLWLRYFPDQPVLTPRRRRPALDRTAGIALKSLISSINSSESCATFRRLR